PRFGAGFGMHSWCPGFGAGFAMDGRGAGFAAGSGFARPDALGDAAAALGPPRRKGVAVGPRSRRALRDRLCRSGGAAGFFFLRFLRQQIFELPDAVAIALLEAAGTLAAAATRVQEI